MVGLARRRRRRGHVSHFSNRGDSMVQRSGVSSRDRDGRAQADERVRQRVDGVTSSRDVERGPRSPSAVGSRRETVAARPDSRREGPTRNRRRPALLALGVVLVLVAALASYATLSAMSGTETVVVTNAPIAKGEVIEAGDLGTIELAGGQQTGAISAEQAPSLVGQYAAVDLPAGSLLTGESVQATLPVAPGTSIVGVALTVGQLPATGLRSGDRVRLVSTPAAQGEPPVEPPLTIDATVFAVRADERTGTVIIDLAVPSSRAADVAARAATGRIALVLDGDGRG